MLQSPNYPLVSAEWLSQQLDRTDLVILDASFFLPVQEKNARHEYESAHIPGALFFDIDEIADHSSTLPHMLPKAEEFGYAAGQLGIDAHSTVVIYDNNNFMASARVWWTFRVFDHDRVYVLDGGLERWKRLGLPTHSGYTARKPLDPLHVTLHPGLVRYLEDLLTSLQRSGTTIIDARPPGRFLGDEPEPRPGLRSGHIPGSKNLFFKDLIAPDTDCLKTPSELKDIFSRLGVDPLSPIITTCGSGVTASILSLALYCLGNKYAAVYDGSWSEWGASNDTPVATGRN